MSHTYPALDREHARRDRSVIDRWRVEVTRSYAAMGASDDLDELARFERLAVDDREWAEGYERGVADAARALKGDALTGPGVMANDRDGWSPSVTRSRAYELGMRDG